MTQDVLIKKLFKLANEILRLKEEGKKLGMFTDDRELLECPECGLMEDVDINGRLFTVFKNSLHKDTRLEFKEVRNKKDYFRCPNCGKEIKVSGKF